MNDSNHTEESIRSEPYVPAPTWSGPLLGMGILAVSTLLGGIYIANRMHEKPLEVLPSTRINNEPETVRANADVSILESMSSSDDPALIEADLNATALDTIEADLQTIDAELGEFEAKLEAL